MARSDNPTATAASTPVRRGLWLASALALAFAAFTAGRLSAPQPQPLAANIGESATAAPLQLRPPQLQPVQLQPAQPAPDDPRELLPLPGPGQQPVPGEGQTGECPLFLYQDGQLFRFDAPGGQPGGRPGPGGGSPELFPLQPVPPPGQPFPQPPSQEPPLDLILFDADPALFAHR